MREAGGSYPEKKARMYRQLREIPGRRAVMAVIRMEKVRSSQILPLRKALAGQVEFVSIKDRVAKKALGGSGAPGMAEMARGLAGQCMLLFTDMSPFRLNVLLAKNRVMMAARGGDVASVDVAVPARNTGIAPGPMLTEFKEAGIPTKIDQGTIWISKDTVPARKGDVIGEKLASILGKLDIKPVEAGVSLHAALEGGTVYSAAELVVDVGAARDGLALAHMEAVSLSVEAAYVTPGNAALVLARAASGARALSAESGHVTAETAPEALRRARARAAALAGRARGYAPA